METFNEEVSNLLKRKIKASLSHVDDLSIGFEYDGAVSEADAREILLLRIVDDVVTVIRGALELWPTRPTLVEIAFFEKSVGTGCPRCASTTTGAASPRPDGVGTQSRAAERSQRPGGGAPEGEEQ